MNNLKHLGDPCIHCGTEPAYGSLCFTVGLRRDFRNCEFSREQKDAAIYYLINLPIIQKIRAESAVTE
jgi:hypothetical protein